MNWNRIDGDSKYFKGNAKDHRNKTDDHADYLADARNHLAAKKQEMYGMNGDDAEGELFDRKTIKKDKVHLGKSKNYKNKP